MRKYNSGLNAFLKTSLLSLAHTHVPYSANSSFVAIISCLVSIVQGIRQSLAMYNSPCRMLICIVHCSIKVIVSSMSLAVVPRGSAATHLSAPLCMSDFAR